MKADNATTLRLCHLCGAQYGGYPALSRKFPNTQICPDCGTREALESIGVSTTEQDKILGIIHRNIHNSDR
ncbi:uncharacterized protein BN782_01074 [Eubacterium sp. CAG:786]|nr:uncharacterized protein BN782_01074 [Eubacterium sp. CAG:786]